MRNVNISQGAPSEGEADDRKARAADRKEKSKHIVAARVGPELKAQLRKVALQDKHRLNDAVREAILSYLKLDGRERERRRRAEGMATLATAANDLKRIGNLFAMAAKSGRITEMERKLLATALSAVEDAARTLTQ